FAIDSFMTRKRSNVSRKPRANIDALFHNYFGLLPNAENENVRDTVVVSDGLGTTNKLKKLKLKFGGVTHTIHTKSKPGNSDARNPKDNADNNDGRSFDKKREFGVPKTESSFASENHSHKRKATGQHSRKSKRANERRAFGVGFSDEEDEDAELHFLGKNQFIKKSS
ncbi:hypothetical protein TSUD_206730, partial [Trifolium subterraneum]